MQRTAANTHCIYRGQGQGKHVCPDCSGVVRIKIFSCELHGSCTIGRLVQGHALCESCADFVPPPEPGTT